jgi:hypothetical protein
MEYMGNARSHMYQGLGQARYHNFQVDLSISTSSTSRQTQRKAILPHAEFPGTAAATEPPSSGEDTVPNHGRFANRPHPPCHPDLGRCSR